MTICCVNWDIEPEMPLCIFLAHGERKETQMHSRSASQLAARYGYGLVMRKRSDDYREGAESARTDSFRVLMRPLRLSMPAMASRIRS